MQPLSNEQVELLAEKKLLGTITPEEQTLLDHWIVEQERTEGNMVWNSGDENEEALKLRLFTRIKETTGIGQPAKVVTMKWWKVAVAASIIGIIGFAVYFIINNEKAIVSDPSSIVSTDVTAPTSNRAQIKLADGSIVYLDSAANGELITANGVQVVKTSDGKIIYNDSRLPTADSRLVFNTLTNPRGSKVIDITLADGSRVWLNAGSSLTYPVAFTDKERKVSVNGEAYFEIAHNENKPFIVSKGETSVTVLGTHFNVNAYDDESNIKVTLLEGSVKVSSVVRGPSSILRPGQQAVVTHDSRLTTHDGIDLETVMAWKEDRFVFDHDELPAIMRQLSRWYNVDVSYEGAIPKNKFSGIISRQRNASAVLAMLKATGSINFRIEGNKLIVTP
jgi:transmembrane sensor